VVLCTGVEWHMGEVWTWSA